jgi:hypothetical protein
MAAYRKLVDINRVKIVAVEYCELGKIDKLIK